MCPACLIQLGLDAGSETPLATPGSASPKRTTAPGTVTDVGTDPANGFGPANLRSLTNGSAHHQTGDFIGPYRLVRVLGEGSMGVVYLAEQEEPMGGFTF